MITDPQRIHLTDPGNPKICNVFSFYKLYMDEHLVKEVEERCKKGLIGCTACKDEISSVIYESLADFQHKRNQLQKDLKYIYDILETGAKKVREIAGITISDVRKKMGID